MKKTSLQELIEELEGFKTLGFITPDVKQGIDIAIEQAKRKLPQHKQEIIDAVNQKQFTDIDGLGIHDTITAGEQYYNETYGQ